MEYVTFNYNMVLNLNKELEKQGIYRHASMFSKEFYQFRLEELSHIEELTIENATDLTNIQYLPNLKRVLIQSIEYTRFGEEVDLDSASFTNNIRDFRPLEEVKTLEELTIVNDINLETLDVSKLENLRNLKIINTPNLTTLKGLEGLQNLKNILIYGTSICSDFDIREYIKNTFEAEFNILDVNMYHSLVKKDESIPEYLSDAVTCGETKLCFAELVGLMEYAVIDVKAMAEMYKLSQFLFQLFGIDEKEDIEKIHIIYEYIVSNTEFDSAGLQDRNQKYHEYIEKYNTIPAFAKQHLAILHSSYSAFIRKKSNCEGIVNLMKFMCNMANIRTFNVHCIDIKNNVNNLPNHAMLRVLWQGNWYYIDPTIDPDHPEDFFMKTYEEIEKLGRHRLNALEAKVCKENYHEQYDGQDTKAGFAK